MRTVWQQIPKWGQAIIWFLLLLYPIVILNQSAILQNIRSYNTFPWAFLFCVMTLWLFWDYTTGQDKVFQPSEHRKKLSATTPSSSIGIGIQILMGLSLFGVVFSANAIGFGLFGTEGTSQLEFIKYVGSAPGLTGPFLLLSAALTAGIVEEVVFRGYMQTILTDNYGRWISFIVVGVIFTLGHVLPPNLYLQYIIVSIAFSWVADRTGSILTGIVVHILFDAMAFATIYFSLAVSDPGYLSNHLPISILLLVLSLTALIYFGLRISDDRTE